MARYDTAIVNGTVVMPERAGVSPGARETK